MRDIMNLVKHFTRTTISIMKNKTFIITVGVCRKALPQVQSLQAKKIQQAALMVSSKFQRKETLLIEIIKGSIPNIMSRQANCHRDKIPNMKETVRENIMNRHHFISFQFMSLVFQKFKMIDLTGTYFLNHLQFLAPKSLLFLCACSNKR